MKNILASFFFFIFLSTVLFAQNKLKSDWQTLVDAEKSFAQTSLRKGMKTAFLTFVADKGILFRPNPVNGKKYWENQKETEAALTWFPIFADISAAAELGYTIGPYQFWQNKNNETPTGHGFFVSIWKKQANGEWKVALDFGNFNPPPGESFEEIQFAEETFIDQEIKKKAVKLDKEFLLFLDKKFAREVKEKGLQTAYQNYAAESCKFLRPGIALFSGKDKIAAYHSEKINSITFKAIDGDIALSDDLGYVYGSFRFVGTEGKNGEGNYLRIWRKSSDKKWYLVFDITMPNPVKK